MDTLDWLDPLSRDALRTDDALRAARDATAVADVLRHVPLYGQPHRAAANPTLREAGATPAPGDDVAFVRGALTATPPAHRTSEHRRVP
jgi:hypothetical protein